MTLEEIRSKALEMAEPQFKKFEPIALANTKKVLEAFKECQVSDYHFTGTTGYGSRATSFCIWYSCIGHYFDGHYGEWIKRD